jgi:NitT/TauT family transport system substrate-binding protein
MTTSMTPRFPAIKKRRRTAHWPVALILLGLALSGAAPQPAVAEISEVRISQQFGLTYLPLIVARNQQLIEKEAAASGIKNLTVTWVRLGGGAATNDALLSGSIDFASAGLGPLLTLWDKTQGNLGIRGVAALDASAVFLNVNRPEIKTLADLKDSDRIALPAVKVSHQAVLLEMAAAQQFGADQYDRFDNLTVTLAHPDAYAALLSGKTEITGHFGVSPFQNQELENPQIHRLLSSQDIVGGPETVTSVFTTSKIRSSNPKVYRAVFAALRDAQDIIAHNKPLAAQIYVEEEKGPLAAADIQKILELSTTHYSAAPINTRKFADFMFQTGALKTKPASWHDYYFPELYALPGS